MAISKHQHPNKYPTTPLDTKPNNQTNKTDNLPFLKINIMIEKHLDKKQPAFPQNKLSYEKKMKHIKIKHKINTVRRLNKTGIAGVIIGITNLWIGAVFIGSEHYIGKIIAYSGMVIFGLGAIMGTIADRIKNKITKRKNKDETSEFY